MSHVGGIKAQNNSSLRFFLCWLCFVFSTGYKVYTEYSRLNSMAYCLLYIIYEDALLI